MKSVAVPKYGLISKQIDLIYVSCGDEISELVNHIEKCRMKLHRLLKMVNYVKIKND